MLRLKLAILFAALYFPGISHSLSQSGILTKGIWKTGDDGVTRIYVCFETQNTSTEEAWAKDALNQSWAYYGKIQFVFGASNSPLKANGNRYACDQGFPGIKITLSDDPKGPGTNFGAVNWVAADAGTEASWPQGMRPSGAMVMRLNSSFVNWPPRSDGRTFSGSEKENLFRHSVVHEFGHALGFVHEHQLADANAKLSAKCLEYIKSSDHGWVSEEDKTKYGFMEYGTYSRLSVMHYACVEDGRYTPAQAEKYLFQTSLGPTDIATVRKLYGDNHSSDFPKAKWGTPSAKILEGVNITGQETESSLRSLLGSGSSSAKLNWQYFSVSVLPVPNIPEPKPDLKPIIPGISFFTSDASIGPNGLPVATLPFPNGSGAQIQYNLVPKTGIVNGVTYPGYEITLQSLDSYYDFAMPQAKTKLYSLSDNAGFTGYTESTENVGAPAKRRVLTFTKQPTYRIIYNSTGNYTAEPINMPANGEYKFWVPMGYGTYDSQMKEFYTELASAPKDLPWIYSPATGKFRVNSNFNFMDLAVWIFKSNQAGTSYVFDKTIRLIFPYYPSDPGAFYSTLRKSTINQVLIRNNGLSGADRIPDLYMDETEVTQKDYQLLMGKNPFNFPLGPDYPVEGVTLYDAILYSNKRSEFEGLNPVYSFTDPVYSSNGNNCIGMTGLTVDLTRNGYRLPTREEWKYAYLANGTSPYYYWPYTVTNSDHAKYAWFNYNAGISSHPVAKKIPNAWGLYDMGGNVMEWTWFPLTNPVGWSQVPQMGGSWADSPFYLKADSFIRGYDNEPCPHGGFRLVRKGPTNIVPWILSPLLLQ